MSVNVSSAASSAGAPALRDPAWVGRVAGCLAFAVVLWPLLVWSEFKPWVLFDARSLAALRGFLAGFWPLSSEPEFMWLLARSTLDTLAMATAGTALAFMLAAPLACAVTRALSISRIGPGPGRAAAFLVRQPVRLILTVLRTVPEVVWALLLVRALGLGPGPGVLAIGLAYGGLLGKVYSEILESTDQRPAQALMEAGSGRWAVLWYALVPGAAQELVSYTVYRWECAVRASVVMGFVGAGGLGQLMDQSIKMLNGGEASAILLSFLALVLLADGLSSWLRKTLA